MTSGSVLKSPLFPTSVVSLGTDYLEDRFESDGSQEKRGPMPELSVYCDAVFTTKSLSFSSIKNENISAK